MTQGLGGCHKSQRQNGAMEDTDFEDRSRRRTEGLKRARRRNNRKKSLRDARPVKRRFIKAKRNAKILQLSASMTYGEIAKKLRALPVRSCIIDGEAIVTNDKGLAVFDLICDHRRHAAELCAFDLLELDGEDHRRVRIEGRKRALAGILGRFQPGIVLNEFSRATAPSSSSMLATLAAKASCQSGSARRTNPAARRTG